MMTLTLAFSDSLARTCMSLAALSGFVARQYVVNARVLAVVS